MPPKTLDPDRNPIDAFVEGPSHMEGSSPAFVAWSLSPSVKPSLHRLEFSHGHWEQSGRTLFLVTWGFPP